MLLIVEIILAIVAWKRGWRGWALLPVANAMAAGFMMGTLYFSTDGGAGATTPTHGFFINSDGQTIFDALAVGVLIVMAIKRRRRAAPMPPVDQLAQKMHADSPTTTI